MEIRFPAFTSSGSELNIPVNIAANCMPGI